MINFERVAPGLCPREARYAYPAPFGFSQRHLSRSLEPLRQNVDHIETCKQTPVSKHRNDQTQFPYTGRDLSRRAETPWVYEADQTSGNGNRW